jgi:hypothetical protein
VLSSCRKMRCKRIDQFASTLQQAQRALQMFYLTLHR